MAAQRSQLQRRHHVLSTQLGRPRNATVEVGGPERIGLDELVRQLFAARSDPRTVITDPSAGYFGAALDDRTLTTSDGARLGTRRFADWLR